MRECNQKINCSVTECRYNQAGTSCSKECITVCCGKDGCTKCESFVSEKF